MNTNHYPPILLRIGATPRLTPWQVGSRIILSFLFALLWFDVGYQTGQRLAVATEPRVTIHTAETTADL